MNIFCIGEDTWGGGEKWMLTTADGLRDRGHRIYFAGRANSLFLHRCTEKNFPVFPMSIKSDFGLKNILKLYRFFKKNQIQVIIANFNKDARLSGIARKLARVPVLVARNGLPILENNWRYRWTYRYLVDGIITNTNAIKNRYLSYGWLPKEFIQVIYNGIDIDQEKNFEKKAILEEFQLPPEKKIVGIFGRLVKQKQHNLFLEAAQKILEGFRNVHFIIVGDGPLRNTIEKQIRSQGLSDFVQLLGQQKKVMALYNICDVILLTSEDEGLPNVVMEAMLTGTPVVAFDVGGVRELINSDEVGYVVPSNDTQLMAVKTLKLLENSNLAKKICKAAKIRIQENFRLDQMIDRIEEYLIRKLDESSEKIFSKNCKKISERVLE